jgi:hypothetical protein
MTMKRANKCFMTGLAVAALIPAFQANAQYKPTGDDGITASPRVRKTLNERPMACPSGSVCSDRASSKDAASDGTAASPKVRAQLEERKRIALAATASASAGTAASTTRAPNDGIAASPKLRELMRGWPAQPQVEIAPIVPAK